MILSTQSKKNMLNTKKNVHKLLDQHFLCKYNNIKDEDLSFETYLSYLQ